MTARWLPALVLLPALAYCCESPDPVRLALRSAVVVAALQILVAYPVAGSQTSWGTVAMVVPCGIALAVGAERSRLWLESGRLVRAGATAVLCFALIVGTGIWPPALWKTYVDSPRLALPGTGLIRLDANTTAILQGVSRRLRADCDTFYGVPNQNSLYIFSGVPAVTGIVANGGPAGLTVAQQRTVVAALRKKERTHERVCVVRYFMPGKPPPGPLATALSQYAHIVSDVYPYTISRHGYR